MKTDENKLKAVIYSAVAPSKEQHARFMNFIGNKYGEGIDL